MFRRCRRTVAAACLGLLLSLPGGCSWHVHRVGTGPTGLGEESERQVYVLFGLLRWNLVETSRLAGDVTGYEIVTEYSWTDLLLAPLLLPLTATSRTVTVRK
jgi:hypothetical protein